MQSRLQSAGTAVSSEGSAGARGPSLKVVHVTLGRKPQFLTGHLLKASVPHHLDFSISSLADIAAGFAPEQMTQEIVPKREAKCFLQANLENDIPSLPPCTVHH